MTTNVPYVKKFNEDGTISNPIKGSLSHQFPNRRVRKEALKQGKFYGESNNFHLTVTSQGKYKRVKQYEVDKEGNKKVIEHYILQN